MRRSALSIGSTLATLFMIVLAAFAGEASEPEHSMRSRPDANSIGIWKAYVPHDLKGEFDSYDSIGLAAGALIKADS